MSVKLFDSELKVMDVLWREGELPAKRISDILKQTVGWNMNTTYTVIKKCIAKGAVERSEPNFRCRALISRDAVQAAETEALLHRLFDGSPDLLFASLIGHRKLSQEQIEKMRQMVDRLQAQEGSE